jgi:hypothetical protein
VAGSRTEAYHIINKVYRHARQWFVIHHTNCGIELFTDEVIADPLDDDLSTASLDCGNWHKGRERVASQSAMPRPRRPAHL